VTACRALPASASALCHCCLNATAGGASSQSMIPRRASRAAGSVVATAVAAPGRFELEGRRGSSLGRARRRSTPAENTSSSEPRIRGDRSAGNRDRKGAHCDLPEGNPPRDQQSRHAADGTKLNQRRMQRATQPDPILVAPPRWLAGCAPPSQARRGRCPQAVWPWPACAAADIMASTEPMSIQVHLTRLATSLPVET
jgi:hypothetical protein